MTGSSVVTSRAANVIWTNTAGGNWNNTNNWSPNTVPASGDTVFITNSGTYAVTVNVSPTLAGLTVGNTNGGTVTVNHASTTLTLNGPSFFETNTAFNFSGGTLDGTGTLILAGAFTWGGGTMDSTGAGGGRTVLTNSATVNFTVTTKPLYRRTVDNYTTVNWTSGQFNAGFGAVWNNLAGSVFDMQGDLVLQYGGGGTQLTFNNNGTLRKTAGAGLGNFVAILNNGNLVSAQSGTLSLDAGGVASPSTFNANGSCVLNFGGGTHTILAGVNFTGAGLHRVNGGTFNVAGPLTMTPSFELASSGILDGANTVTFTGPFTWSGGTMESSSPGGKTVFTNSATVNFTVTTKTLYRRTVDNYTTVNWTSGQFNAGFGAVWNNLAGSSFDVQADLTLQYAGGGNQLAFNNAGIFKKSAGGATATITCVFTNSGTVRSQSGVLGFPTS